MEQCPEDHVRTKAHGIWEAAGRPDGEHESHWQQALKELGLVSPVEQGSDETTFGKADIKKRRAAI